ncbi:MAG: hypothetical protein JWL63_1782 [Rhodocyclales bacterium]|nr:hypothetical protein [Rhodocyclales bacterium]
MMRTTEPHIVLESTLMNIPESMHEEPPRARSDSDSDSDSPPPDPETAIVYAPYVLGIASRIDDIEAISGHIRRRRWQALGHSLLVFSMQVAVVALGIVIGVSQKPGTHRAPHAMPEAIHVPDRQTTPVDFGAEEQADPVVDEMPPTFVYTRADMIRSRAASS